MTTAEMLRAEGEARGEARGEALGRGEAIVQVLTVKFGALPEDVPGRVRAAASEQIQEWTVRAVTADTLDQVFG